MATERTTNRRFQPRAKRVLLAALASTVLVVGVAAFGVVRFGLGLTSLGRAEESPSGLREIAEVDGVGGMVVAAHPEATRIGRDLLAAGGNALDAAIGVQLALGLVEPDCSGIGGGAFLLYWDASERRLYAFDGRERAPMSASTDYLMDADGEPMRFDRALIGGRSVGVPGVMRMLERAHRDHGRLPWARTFEEAIALAEGGFELSPRLNHLTSYDPIIPTVPSMRRYFLDADGEPWPVGHRLANPEYAEVLRAMQSEGADALYRGSIARDIVAAVENGMQPSTARLAFNVVQRGLGLRPGGEATQPAPGQLTLDDLAQYEATQREPLCRPYRGHRVCAFGPPTSGGVAVLQILGVLEHFELAELAPTSPEATHLFAEAQRLAYADRGRWLGDPDAVDVPVEGLLDPTYLDERAASIDPNQALTAAVAGTPPGAELSWQSRPSPERPSTSHFSIVDEHGNVASMTTSVEAPFGAHLMVRGFVLNNELTDFSFAAEEDGRIVANAPGPGKRPRSSMSPLVVFDPETNAPRFVIGSPGGGRIIAYVAQTAIGLIDWGLSPQEAVSLPHVVAMDATVELESIGWDDDDERDALEDGLEAMGHDVDVSMLVSGLHVIEVRNGHLRAGVDPRREGRALVAPSTRAD